MAMAEARAWRAGMLASLLTLAWAPPATGEQRAGWAGKLDRAVGSVVSPGELAIAHVALEGATNCTSCHGKLEGTPDALCLDCHSRVAERLLSGEGAHGSFRATCSQCHAEHRGAAADLLGLDHETFNHDQARFQLRGAHRDADCDSCHERAHQDTGRVAFRTLGLLFSRCADCHSDDPHEGAFGDVRDCAECHTERSFDGDDLRLAAAQADAGFLHDRDTDFPLSGLHASVACRDCHAAAPVESRDEIPARPGASAPTSCFGCHDDPHDTALGDDCARCHSEQGWSGPDAVFDHTVQTSFALDPLHASLSCESCHEAATFSTRASDCAGCHADAEALLAGRFAELEQDADPHAADIECRGCHPEAQTSTRLLDQQRVCIECHEPSYARLLVARKQILDDLVVRVEFELRRIDLADDRGEASADSSDEARATMLEEVGRMARSGLHHPDLAEAFLGQQLQQLDRSGSSQAR
jgi:hypothetical protein